MVCSSLVDLPHADLSACRLALAKEMDAILKRAKRIAETRRDLNTQRLRELDAKLSQSKPKRRRSRAK
jgi:hypothetical protein